MFIKIFSGVDTFLIKFYTKNCTEHVVPRFKTATQRQLEIKISSRHIEKERKVLMMEERKKQDLPQRTK